MKDFNYSEKIHNAKTTEERSKINSDFIKHRKKLRKIETIKNFAQIIFSIYLILLLPF